MKSLDEFLVENKKRVLFNMEYDVTKPENFRVEEDDRRLNEDKFSRKIGEILKGNVPRVKTFAILTGQNPQSQQATKEFNLDKKNELEAELEQGKFGFRRVEGMFDNLEISYFIPNIEKSVALDIGKRYLQTSIVFGEIKTNKKGETYADMAEIYTSGKAFSKIKHKSKVFIELPDATNYYSKTYGKKFTIPFTRYTSDLKKGEWADKTKTTIKTPDGDLFDSSGKKIDNNKIPENILQRVESLSKNSLDESRTGKYKWECRAEISSLLSKYIISY